MRLENCILHTPTHTLASWARQFNRTSWGRAFAMTTEALAKRKAKLRGIIDAPHTAEHIPWIEAGEVAQMTLEAIRAVISKNSQINVITVSLRAMELGRAEEAVHVVNMASTSKINLHARVILRTAALRSESSVARIMNRIYNTTLESLVEEPTYTDALRLKLHSVLQERRAMLATADPTLAQQPWVTVSDAIKLKATDMEALLKARPDIDRSRAFSCLCAEKCDKSEHLRRIAKISRGTQNLNVDAFSDAVIWGDPGTRLLELFKSPHQEKTYEAVFECLPWMNNTTRPHLIVDAASRPNWQILFKIMLPLGFSLAPQRQCPLWVARNRRVADVPQEAQVPYDTEALVWLAKFATRDHVVRAIRAGHRIWRRESIADHGGMLTLLRDAAWPMKWTTRTHALLPREIRDLILAFIMGARRMLYLPHNITTEIFTHLVPNTAP